MSDAALKPNQLFVYKGVEYRFIRIESYGRVKAAHIGTGIRVSLHQSAIDLLETV